MMWAGIVEQQAILLSGSLACQLSSSGKAVAQQQGVPQRAMKKEDKVWWQTFQTGGEGVALQRVQR